MKIVLVVAVFISHIKETYGGRANELNNSKNPPDPKIFLPIRSTTHNDNSSDVVALLHNIGFSSSGPTTNIGTLEALVLYGTSDSFIEIENEGGQFTGHDAMCWLFYIYYDTMHTNAVLMSYEGDYGGFTLRLTGHTLSAVIFDHNGVQRVHQYTQTLTSSAWNFIGTNFNKLWDDEQFDLFAFDNGYDKNRIDTIGFGAVPPEVLIDAKGKIKFGQGSDGTGSFQGRMSCFQFYNVSMIGGALKDAVDLCDPNIWTDPSYSVGGTFDAMQTTVSMTTMAESTIEQTTVPPTTEKITTEEPVTTNQATTATTIVTTLQQTTEESVTTTQTATTETLTTTVPPTTEQITTEAQVTTTQSATTETLTSTVPPTTEQATTEAPVTTTQSASTEIPTSNVPPTTEQTTTAAQVTTTETTTTETLTSAVPPTTEDSLTTTQGATTEVFTSTVPLTTFKSTSDAQTTQTVQSTTGVYMPPLIRCVTFTKIMENQIIKNPLFSLTTTTMHECIEIFLKDQLCVVMGISKQSTSVQCSCGSNSDVTGISGGYDLFMLQ